MRKILSTLIVISAFISANAIAAPKVLYKENGNTIKGLSASTPVLVSNFVNEIIKKQPDLYEIILAKYNDHYVVYLLSGTEWKVTKIRLDVDGNAKLKVIENYHGLEQQTSVKQDDPACPDPTVQVVAISAYPGVASVDEALKIVQVGASTKYKTEVINTENADGKTYKNWLSCPNLKAFYSVGHGSPEEIIVGNGDKVDSLYFRDDRLKNIFKNTTVVINSCLVYNWPFGAEIMYGNTMSNSDYESTPGPNAYEYVGGHNNLLMHSSETSSACFLIKAMNGSKMDFETLQECIGNKNINIATFGISHPGYTFKN